MIDPRHLYRVRVESLDSQLWLDVIGEVQVCMVALRRTLELWPPSQRYRGTAPRITVEVRW